MKYPVAALLALAATSTSAFAQTILIDFGEVTGDTTDTGNWNNSVASTTESWDITDLITSTGATTTIDLNMVASGSGEQTNAMGVTQAPTPFNISTVYSDAIFTTGANIVFDFEQLDSNSQYRFTFFGSRDSTQTRITDYTVVGATTAGPQTITTSGIDAGGASSGINHNIANVAQTAFISPDGSNEIRVTVGLDTGSFGYLNGMQIEIVPEPSAYGLLAGTFALGFIMIRRRR